MTSNSNVTDWYRIYNVVTGKIQSQLMSLNFCFLWIFGIKRESLDFLVIFISHSCFFYRFWWSPALDRQNKTRPAFFGITWSGKKPNQLISLNSSLLTSPLSLSVTGDDCRKHKLDGSFPEFLKKLKLNKFVCRIWKAWLDVDTANHAMALEVSKLSMDPILKTLSIDRIEYLLGATKLGIIHDMIWYDLLEANR